MSLVDVGNKTLTLKIVYYGCAMGGKTTNLVTLHRLTDPKAQQGLVSIATNDDRTLFFDLLPVDLGQVGGLNVRVKLYTVPGQVHYELTRRQVLAGADGVVFVVDSTPGAAKPNAWAYENLRYNLRSNGLDPNKTPTVIQWNKRDLPDARPVWELQAELNPHELPEFAAVATVGTGVVETLSGILKKTLEKAYVRTGRTPITPDQIARNVDRALEAARAVEPAPAKPARKTFSHTFDMDRYRDDQATEGRDRRIVDEAALLSESVETNMKLAEELDGYQAVRDKASRQAVMMNALSKLAPMLADPAEHALPRGVMARLLEGAGRTHGSLLLFRTDGKTMDEREVLPDGKDVLNATSAEGLGTVAYRLSQHTEARVVEDLTSEVFFGDEPPGAADLASLLIAPLGCDGLHFGRLFVYSRVTEEAFDDTEFEYWTTASSLVGLSLHWHALRRKLAQTAVC